MVAVEICSPYSFSILWVNLSKSVVVRRGFLYFSSTAFLSSTISGVLLISVFLLYACI